MKIHPKLILFLCVCFTLERITSACNKYFGLEYGSQKIPGRSCVDIIRQRCDKLKDGTYWIKLSGQVKSFPVFCNMEAGGWTMVFKLVAGIPGRPATAWNLPFTTFEYSLAALNSDNDFKHHYKNRIVQKWRVFAPSEVRLVFYKQGKEEVVLRFNAANSNNKNWFSQARIIDAPWQNILTEKKNFFAIEGSCSASGCRDFFINRSYGGCDADQGWFYVGDSATCKWESRLPAGVKLIYSKTAKHVNYNSYSHVGTADVFAVYLR